MADYSPMSRDEKLLRKLLGQSVQTEPPQSRIEFLLQEIIDGGGIGGGSYKIKDQYDTLAELEAAHPTGADGDAYLVGDPTHIYVWLDDRQEYADGGLFAAVPGLDGVGIQSIEKTSTSGLVDTYTITYTDGDTDTFTVTNGEEGVGITDISKTSTVGKIDTYTITLSNGDTYDFTVTNGEGVGVPEGGTTGQVLVKKSNTDYDTEWANAGAGEGVPAGGTTGQILAKKTGADYDTEWVDNEGGSDVTSEIESLSAATSELASETGSLASENSVQTSEIASQTSEINSLASENSSQSSEIASLSSSMSEVVSEISSMSVSDISSQLNSLSAENSTQTSEIGSLSQSMSELASAAASTSASQSEIDSEQDVAIASLTSENSTQTSEIGSLASEIDSMSTSDYTSEINSLHTETSELAVENSTQTSEIGSLGVSMSELADAASSTSTSQSEIDSTQDVSLASLSTENSTQTSEIGSLSTASSELASEVEVIGSEVAEKQDALVEGPGIDIDSSTNEIKTERVVFEGTLQEWEALTTAEKKSYTDAIITNDEQTGIVDQTPTENSNNLVTSGGVFDAISDKTSINDSSTSSTTQTWSASKIYSETSNKLLSSLVSIGGQNVAFNFEQNKLKIMLTLNASTKVLLQFSADPTTDGYKVAFYVTNDGEQSWQTYWSIPS